MEAVLFHTEELFVQPDESAAGESAVAVLTSIEDERADNCAQATTQSDRVGKYACGITGCIVSIDPDTGNIIRSSARCLQD